MSPEREVPEKFREAMETKNIDIFAPCVAEDATVDVLPSTVGGKLTGAQWIGMITEKANSAQSAKFDIIDVIEHPLFIFFQVNVAAKFPSGYLFTHVIAFAFQYTKESNGSLKVTSVIEYLDSFKVKELQAKLGGDFRLACDA